MSGDLPAHRLPIVPGHQVVGVIEAVGPEVESSRIGQAVGVSWFAGSCGHCAWCLEGRQNLCEQAEFTGWYRDGGYTTSMLARADCAFELPADYRPELTGEQRAVALSPLLCGGVIGYRSLRIAEVDAASAGLRLGLYGYGASATLVMQVAKFWGVEPYVVTRSESEVERALAAGAAWAGTYDQPLPVRLNSAITFAPSGDVVVSALKSLERGGTVAVNAIHLDRVPEFNYDDLWWERSIRSVANVTPSDVREFPCPGRTCRSSDGVRGTPSRAGQHCFASPERRRRVGLVCVNDVECGTCRTFQLLRSPPLDSLLASQSPTPPATAPRRSCPRGRWNHLRLGMEPQVRAADSRRAACHLRRRVRDLASARKTNWCLAECPGGIGCDRWSCVRCLGSSPAITRAAAS